MLMPFVPFVPGHVVWIDVHVDRKRGNVEMLRMESARPMPMDSGFHRNGRDRKNEEKRQREISPSHRLFSPFTQKISHYEWSCTIHATEGTPKLSTINNM